MAKRRRLLRESAAVQSLIGKNAGLTFLSDIAHFRPVWPLLRSFTVWELCFFFFFSSRRRHTRLQGDWSSDVCSSDLSKCYRSSAGRMSCLTCHDPHEQPRSDSASYYRKRCLGCHTETSCSLPLVARRRKAPPDDCAGCHMPKQSLTLISHSSLTNHRIVAYEGEPYPEEAFHQTSPELPDLVHVNAVPGECKALSPLVLLQAYGELMGSHPQYRERYLGLLDQLARTEPDNPVV